MRDSMFRVKHMFDFWMMLKEERPMKKNRLVSLLLCFCMIFALLPSEALAATAVTKITITMSDLKVGRALPTNAQTSADASTEVVNVEWTGQSDNGGMMYDVLNPVVITVRIKEGKDAKFSSTKEITATVNHRKATVERLDDKNAIVRYTFEATKSDELLIAEKKGTVCSLDVTVTTPADQEAPDTVGKIVGNGVVKYAITGVAWTGELNGDGTFKHGVEYTVTISARILDGKDINFYALGNKINHQDAVIVSLGGKDITCSYTFPAFKAKDVVAQEKADAEAEKQASIAASEAKLASEKRAAEVSRRMSRAEADQSYPLNDPITLLVSEDNVDMDYLNGNSNVELFSAVGGGLHQGPYHTLDGGVVINDGLPWVNKNYHETINYYRINRVVCDLYREDDYSLIHFPNVTELWLSPKCDIQGILNNIGREQYVGPLYGGDKWNFNTYRCTVFIPDTLYPNGPKYSSGIPGCRVMLYSGDDVYAAAERGAAAARDWCTNHSYTYEYMSCDRQASYATCCSDERFYYSCSKCGKCEYNPNHTFYTKLPNSDNKEDNGLFTAHTFTDHVLTDEHLLGVKDNGDRVYLKACHYCGKDQKQVDTTVTYNYYKNVMGMDGDQSWWQSYVEGEKKNWSPGGAVYEKAMAATPAKENGLYDSYAIAADKFIWANVSAWARKDVQDAANAGLVDKALLGDDYTYNINRQQFASIAVKMAERMTGKTITPASAGTFTDTDSEYALKAYAAGITTGTTATTFDPYGALNRQQMATFLYRALQYVKNNSDTEYTIYDSKLGYYSDFTQIADWATEAMAFMNALGLVNGTTDTTLAPNAGCTIEQALIVAQRSLDAGGIGWYQCISSFGSDGYYSSHHMALYTYGDRVWFTSSQGECVDPYGNEAGVTVRDFGAIKDR